MTPEFLIQLFWSRRWLILFVLVLTLATGYWLTVTAVPQYKATTTLVLSFNAGNPFEDSGMPRQNNAAYLATQIDILQSRRIARDALATLPRQHLEQVASDFLDDYPIVSATDEELIPILESFVPDNLEVDALRESRVVALRYTSSDPETSAAVANGFAQAYIAMSLELAVAPARQNALWFDEQLVLLRQKLAEKQATLTAYQKDKGIISYNDRLDQEMARFEALADDLAKAQGRVRELRSSQVGSQHPEYRRATQQEQATRESLAAQERRVFDVKEERDELELLGQDVENARRSYDIALQEFYETSMKSQFNQSSVSILSPATPPGQSLESSLLTRMIAAAILGLFLGIMLAVVAELLNRRVRTVEDVEEGLGLPVIASI
jgi:uncharacterized protein involved in exopolysaccharide biosynthesis